jgi:hypothetical protein
MYGCIYYINQFSYHYIYHIYHDGTVYHMYYQTVPAYNQILFHTGYIDDNMSERGLCLWHTSNPIFEHSPLLWSYK